MSMAAISVLARVVTDFNLDNLEGGLKTNFDYFFFLAHLHFVNGTHPMPGEFSLFLNIYYVRFGLGCLVKE